MRLPRDMDARELINLLHRVGYRTVRQTGSHVRLETDTPERHALTVPDHAPLKLGTLSAILAEVAAHRGVSKEALVELLLAR